MNRRWPKKRLREVLEAVESGSRPKGGVRHISHGVLSIGAEHLDGSGGFNFENLKFIPTEFFKTLKRGKIKQGDVLVVKDGATTGKVSLIKYSFPYKEAAVNEHVFVLRPKREILLNEYLFFFLFSQNGREQLLSTFHGAAQGGINTQFVDHINIPLPPLEVQKRIVAKIERLFAKIDEASCLRAESSAASAALLPSALHDVFSRAEREGWEEIKLIDICEKTKLVQPEKISKDSFNYIDITSVSEMDGTGEITARVLPVKEAPSRARKLVREGDIIFATTRPYLKRIAFIPKELSNLIASTGFCVLRPKEGIADSSYVFHIVNSDNFVSKIIPFQRGASYPAVSDKDVLSQTIPLPTIAEQKKIVAHLDALSAKARQLQSLQEATGNEFAALRQSILAHELGSA